MQSNCNNLNSLPSILHGSIRHFAVMTSRNHETHTHIHTDLHTTHSSYIIVTTVTVPQTCHFSFFFLFGGESCVPVNDSVYAL